MNEHQIGEIAETIFKARFGDVKLVRVDVRPGFDHCDAPMVDVNIVYDGKYEQMDPAILLRVRSEIVTKVWREEEDSTRYPYVNFIAMSSLGQRDPATV